MEYRIWNTANHNTSHSRGGGFTSYIWDVPVRASQTPQTHIAPCRVARIDEVNPAPSKRAGFLWQ